MPDAQTITAEQLVKVYPGGVKAVAGIDFSVREGEFFGFLGPNGAGKSTTMKILATLLKKTSGRVTVDGHDVDRDPMAVRKAIGFAMQEVGLDDLSKGRDFLMMQGLLYGLSQKDAKQRAEELLELVGLTAVASRKVGTYSGGMRRRIDLAGALVHKPRILFLDEPTTGLDPQSRIVLWEHLEQLNRQGTTIFLTTQAMEEADRLCERIAIIDRGVIAAEGSPKALKQDVGGDVITISLASKSEAEHVALVAKAQAVVKERTYVSAVSAVDHSLRVTVKDGSAAAPDLMRLLHDQEVPVANLAVASPTLDDVFLKHTGRKIRTESTSGDEVGQAMRPFMGLSKR